MLLTLPKQANASPVLIHFKWALCRHQNLASLFFFRLVQCFNFDTTNNTHKTAVPPLFISWRKDMNYKCSKTMCSGPKTNDVSYVTEKCYHHNNGMKATETKNACRILMEKLTGKCAFNTEKKRGAWDWEGSWGDGQLYGCQEDGSSSGSCPLVGFHISDAEPFDWLINQLVEWSVSRSTGLLFGWTIGISIGRLTGKSIRRLTGLSIHPSMDRSTGRLT
jgi:hypothetical protein